MHLPLKKFIFSTRAAISLEIETFSVAVTKVLASFTSTSVVSEKAEVEKINKIIISKILTFLISCIL